MEARKEFARSNAEILFLIMVDREGKVVKVKMLKTKLDSDRATMMFKKHVFSFEFKPATPTEPDFREFIYPMDVTTSVDY